MNRDDIVGGLRWLKPESGDFICEGCGWENSCGTRGCRIVREAADMLENDESQAVALQRELALRQAQLDCAAASSAVLKKQNEQMRDAAATVTRLAAEAAVERNWISVEDRLPGEAEEDVLAIVSGSPKRNLTLQNVAVIAVYCGEDGWYVNEYPEWEDPTVTYWMPLPEPPEEDNHGPTNI